jgi:hypothetical protein
MKQKPALTVPALGALLAASLVAFGAAGNESNSQADWVAAHFGTNFT